MSEPGKKKVIVIGAGTGGIAIAARLAQSGLAVTVLEKNSFTGGRCSLLYHHHDGNDDESSNRDSKTYRFDQGPSLLLLPRFFTETFSDLGTSLAAEGVELLRCVPNYLVWFSDGALFELTPDLARLRAQIERWEGPEGFARFLCWLREAHAHCEASARVVLRRNFASLLDLRHLVAALPRLHPFHSVWGRASRYFRTERLRRVFTFASMYMGMSPFDAPGTYSLLQYAELAEGVWYPRGGFHAVLAALRGVGERLGVEYRLGAPVERILLRSDGRAARGVQLESGEVLEADVVVVNADLVYAYGNLFPQTRAVRRYVESLRRRPGSCSSISFYWSLNRKVPELQTHNIFLADEYRESFDAIFDRHALPDEPSFYVNVPSRIDPSAAPADCDALIVLVPTGHLAKSRDPSSSSSSAAAATDDDGQEEDISALVSRARSAVLSTIEARTGCAPLAESIMWETVNDPRTWESRFNLDKGSILGLSHGFFNVLAFRPGTRAISGAGSKNTYFVGASTHPGTGVPIVLAGAKITAQQILDDLRVPAPWPPGGDSVGWTERTNKLDKIHSPALLFRGWLLWVLAIVLLAYLLGRYYSPLM